MSVVSYTNDHWDETLVIVSSKRGKPMLQNWLESLLCEYPQLKILKYYNAIDFFT